MQPITREFVACVKKRGGTESVTVNARTPEEARERLMKLGYEAVLSMSGEQEQA